MAPRRKAARIDAPSTLPEATTMIARYLELSAQVDGAKAEADAAIRQIEHHRDLLVAPYEAEIRDLFGQLRTWWAVARLDLTQGKRRSIELAGAVIGERVTPPALKIPKGMKTDVATGFLRSLVESFPGLGHLLRTKTEIDRPAMIRLLGNATAVGPAIDRIREEGFAVVQRDEFFIDRAAEKTVDPEIQPEREETIA